MFQTSIDSLIMVILGVATSTDLPPPTLGLPSPEFAQPAILEPTVPVQTGTPLFFWILWVILLALYLFLAYQHFKNDGNERSTISKMLTGTFLSNGVLLSFFGGVGFFVGMSLRNSLEFQLRRQLGEICIPTIMMVAGVVLMFYGIMCLGAHYSKKKSK